MKVIVNTFKLLIKKLEKKDVKLNIKEYFRNKNIIMNVIISIYISAFLIATSTHSYDLLRYGFFPYVNSPLWANIYWTSLTFLDPFSIIVLLLNIRFGVVFYSVIIVSDVIINMYLTIINQGLIGLVNIFMIGQILFLLIVLITFKQVWRVSK